MISSYDGEIAPDPAEASEVRWMGFDELVAELAERPEVFAAWAPMVLTMVMADIGRNQN